ncbi:MAG: M17 family peptidase N-terminal domain-containing protein, partial [Ignavibacteriaceae bacterium]
MFKLQIKAAGKKIMYKPLSISVKYLIEEKKLSGSLNNLEKIFNIKLSSLQKKNFLAENGSEIRISKPSGKPDAIILSKVKINKDFTSDFFRNHLAGVIKSLEGEELQNLHIFIPSYKAFKNHFENEAHFYQTFIEGLMLGNYKFDKYKLTKKALKKLTVLLYSDNEKLLKESTRKVTLLMEGVYFTKELQNEPANSLRPSDIANKIKSKLRDAGIRVTVFNEKELKKRKMGGLLAVGQGSNNKPRLVILNDKPRTKPKGKKKTKKIALVGKGVTFDSGGISLKPANNMGEMKADMSGAALV